MRHPLLVEWENRMKKLFDEVDDFLEDKYGNAYSLHPNRASRGKTSNKEHDGLFNVGASFSAGFGSSYGRGYVIDVNMVTLENVPSEKESEIINDVVDQVKVRLPVFFPDRKLDIDKDGNVFKIHGDFQLGNTSK
ncbi:MAG: hypothetical protein JW874_05255 [Spirochaetales bacterium]|nr:hypothetical protein [Spirochaetales bacterium]